MIDRKELLSDLQSVLKDIEADLIARSDSDELPEVKSWLETEYQTAKEAERTALNFTDWLNDHVTQVAAGWVLSCVFVRFLEDNQLIDPPRISGAGERLDRARDEQTLFFQDPERAKLTDREYLLSIFTMLAESPYQVDIFTRHNPIHFLPNWLSGDAATVLLNFFRRIDSDAEASNTLIHDFTDPDWDTRFLGDLYQDLSERARKKYALLQTPDFVEEFILDRTLEPALDEFGLEVFSDQSLVVSDEEPKTNNQKPKTNYFKLIDPACGSGHFLLGAFPRILDRWQKKEPGTHVRELVQRTLNSIHGVDINPFAIAIARFRLLLAALKACDTTKLADSPAFKMNLACGDSLYHGRQRQQMLGDWTDESHYFQLEDTESLTRILQEGTFHAVVANPPYITPKDKAANQAYRRLYPDSCHRQYSLSVPFMDRIFGLAVGRESLTQSREDAKQGSLGAGYTGQITANSFMKREFGKKLIESFFKKVDLTHVIDTSGAYIPGHGTPTTILFGRNRKPVSDKIRTVMGIRGEPSTPEDAAQGKVWTAIVDQVDQPGSESEFISAGDSERELFQKHPWSIGGGGAAELKEKLGKSCSSRLASSIETICSICLTRADDIYLNPAKVVSRQNIASKFVVRMIEGEQVRDWGIEGSLEAVFPYDENLNPVKYLESQRVHQFLWPAKEILWRRRELGGDHRELDRTWWEWNRFLRHRFKRSMSISFAEVATHNHFVLDRGGKVFKQTAPVIKLPAEATEDDHLSLLGLLNSSTACFWMKQVCHQKQMMGGDGIRIASKAKVPYAFNGTALGKMPIPEAWLEGALKDRLLVVTKQLDEVSQQYANLSALDVIEESQGTADGIRGSWQAAQNRRVSLRSTQIWLQEEIDFIVYEMFGLTKPGLLAEQIDMDAVILTEGHRPFCFIDGTNEDGFTVPSELPSEWPKETLTLWQRRIEAVKDNKELRLIESAMYKRRWIGRQGLFNHNRTSSELLDAAKAWLTDRLESYFDFDGRMSQTDEGLTHADAVVSDQSLVVSSEEPKTKHQPLTTISLYSLSQLANAASSDPQFHEVGSVYRDDEAFNVLTLVEELVKGEHVPLLPVLRYKEPGLRKRTEWEKTWQLQRLEDELRDGKPLSDPRVAELLDDCNITGKQREKIEGWLAKTPESERTDTTLPSARDLDKILAIPVPPKYKSSDMISTGGAKYWKLRGKLDVPKERWISFPHCDAEDGSMMVCWAGYDHLQQATAIAAWYVRIKEELGGSEDKRLIPLLAALIELIPWLKQWHNEPSEQFAGMKMGDYYEGFIKEEARSLPKKTANPDDENSEETITTGWTLDEIKAWKPPATTRRRRRSS